MSRQIKFKTFYRPYKKKRITDKQKVKKILDKATDYGNSEEPFFMIGVLEHEIMKLLRRERKEFMQRVLGHLRANE